MSDALALRRVREAPLFRAGLEQTGMRGVRKWHTPLIIPCNDEDIMLYDSLGGGPGDTGPFCTRCNLPIGDEPSQRLFFQQDPHGHQGLTGPYHERCAKPFAAFERILNINPWARF